MNGVRKVSKKGRVYFDNGDHIVFQDTGEIRKKNFQKTGYSHGQNPHYGPQQRNNQNIWDGFKRSGWEMRENENGRMYGFGWKKTKQGMLKFSFSENPKGKSGKITSGKNKGEEYVNGVLNITNQNTLAEIVEPCNAFQRKDGEYYLTSNRLGLILTTRGSGKTRSGKVSKGAIVKMKK